ncbi:hypothetical protein EB230_23415 [Mesorhizobium sp. NZP2234]|uniref:hypothetical protein n=1 Tax=Mesorhizobium sp. NZP2234 TaxID=2483402 RepID=UPI0015558390|nr:hypothetical protein [Mesorhizobium sp. NZP2234]QKC91025.1 hypothetical protein EB230_23415 [Mesorhizobium sp. NZP2234]
MVGIAPEVWFPIITLGVGAGITALSQKISDTRQLTREREARREQRRETISLRRVEFQRATLLELQERLLDLGRMVTRAQLEDFRALETSGKWRLGKLSEEVNEGCRLAQASVTRLLERVRDDQVRALASSFSEICVSVTLARSKADSDSYYNKMLHTSGELNARLGVVLRSLDDDEDHIIK